MELKIKLKEVDEIKEVTISFAKQKLTINIGNDAIENNKDWNTKSINDFLINVASSLDESEKIQVKSDESENPIYNYIVKIFKAFSDEYNKDDISDDLF